MTHKERFSLFHKHNPEVYEFFKKFTLEVIAKDFKQWSADAVMHRVRWEANVVTGDPRFRVNNNYVAFYARLFMAEYPQHNGFFETRTRITV